MPIFKVTTEIEAENLSEAWALSAQGHPRSFAPNTDWNTFKRFRIEDSLGAQVFEQTVEKENN